MIRNWFSLVAGVLFIGAGIQFIYNNNTPIGIANILFGFGNIALAFQT